MRLLPRRVLRGGLRGAEVVKKGLQAAIAVTTLLQCESQARNQQLCMLPRRLDHPWSSWNRLLSQDAYDVSRIHATDAMSDQDSVNLCPLQVTRLLRRRGHLEDFPEPGIGIDVSELEDLRVVSMQLLPQAVAEAQDILLEILPRPHQGPKLDDGSVIETQTPVQVAVGP